MNRSTVLAVLLGAACQAYGQGGTLTTTFAGGFNAGGCFFNLSTSRSGGIWLRQVQAQVTAPIGANTCGSLYWREGGYAGHTTSAAGWQQSFRVEPQTGLVWACLEGPMAAAPVSISPAMPTRSAA